MIPQGKCHKNMLKKLFFVRATFYYVDHMCTLFSVGHVVSPLAPLIEIVFDILLSCLINIASSQAFHR